MQAQPHGSLALPADASQVRCVCFHPTLQTAFVAIDVYVIEYDLSTQARLSTFKVPAGNIISLQFLPSRQAWVAVFEDGHVLVVAGETVISELQCTKLAREKLAVLCATIQDNPSLPMLYFVRKGSRTVQGGPLLSPSKTLWRFEGHKKPVMMVATHPSYPLMAAAADNGTVRIWRTDTMALYNIAEAGNRQGSRANVVVTVALQFDKVPAKSQKTSSGAVRKTGKKKLRTISVFFSKVRLIVAHEKGAIMLFDVSIPGAPQTLRTLHNPGAVFLGAHLHPSIPGLMFTLDSRGMYTAYSFSADPTLEGKGKGQSPTTEMNFIQLADHIEPFQVNITPKARSSITSEWSSPDDDGFVTSPPLLPSTLKAYIHPGNFVLFTGEDVLPHGASHRLAVHRYHQAAAEPGDTHPVASPLPAALYFPAPRWLPSKPGPAALPNNVFFVDGPAPGIALKMFAISTQATTTISSCKLPVTLGKAGERIPLMHHNVLRLVTSQATVVRKEPGPRFLLFLRAALSRTSGGLVKLTARTRGLFPTATHSADCQYRYFFTMLPHVAIGGSGVPSASVADPWCFLPGLDGVFVGPNDAMFLIVDEHGFQVTLYAASKESGTAIPLPEQVTRVFATPLGANSVVFYFKPAAAKLTFSANHESCRHSGGDALLTSAGLQPSGPSLTLLRGEVPVQVTFQPDVLRGTQSEPAYLVAVLTTHRLLLLRDNLTVLTTIAPVHSPLKSIFWLGRTLVYNTGCSLHYLTTDGLVETQTSMPTDAVIVGALNDRLIGASREEGKTTFWSKHVHIFNPLAHGVCTDKNGDDMVDDAARYALLKHITSQYDCSSASPSVLARLNAVGFNDLSLRLGGQPAKAGRAAIAEGLPWQEHFRYLLDANDVASALSILMSVYLSHVTNDGTTAGTAKEMQEASPFFPAFLDLLCRSVALDSQQVAAKALKSINNLYLVLKCLKQRADPATLQYVARHCEAAAAPLLPLARALLRSLEGCGTTPAAEGPPKRDWTLCTQVREVELHSLVSPGDGEDDWREESVFVPALAANNLLQLLGVPPIEGGAEGADDAAGQVDYGTADWGGDFTGGDDSASSVGPSDDYQTESLGDDFGDDDPKAAPSSDAAEGAPKEKGDKDGSDGEEDDDEVSKQQEELRRQYLASYSGGGDEDEDSDEEGGPRRPRMKIKFKISDTAVVKPAAPVAPISLGMAMPLPGLGGPSKRKPGRAGLAGPPGTLAPPAAEDKPVSEAQQSQQSPADLFREGLAAMDRGKFAEALRSVAMACDLLVQDSTQIAKKTQIISVVQYKAALSLLIKVKDLEGPPGGPPPGPEVAQQLAFLTLLLMQLSLLPKHQLICQKMASRKNYDAGNWHGAARILKELIAAAPEKVRGQLEEELRHCEANGNTSTLPEPTKRDKINFCWETFKLLRVPGEASTPEEAEFSAAVICAYCPAMFDAVLHPAGEVCPMCKCGQLEQPFNL